MLLVIPSITIKNGKCVGSIRYPETSLHYDEPEDRARLLRKENAKAIHLIFEGGKEWSEETLALIERIRKAVDIPIVISLSELPDDIPLLKQIMKSGVYRVFLPSNADDYFLSRCINDLSCQKIVVSLPLAEASQAKFEQLHTDGLTKICISLEPNMQLPLNELQEAAKLAKKADVRLSLLFGVYSYKQLIEVAKLDPGFDSVILGSALEENSFPCQGIWRSMEIQAASFGGNEVNLWKNPLEGMPHL